MIAARSQSTSAAASGKAARGLCAAPRLHRSVRTAAVGSQPSLASRPTSSSCSSKNPEQPAALRHLGASAAALAAALMLGTSMPAYADLNELEAEAGGEFGRGSSQQFGDVDISGRDFSGQDLRRSNFTSADARNCNFKGAKLQGAYFIKAVVPYANFEDADLSDVLMDRAVMVEANLTNAILERAVFTRSDLNKAIIQGADFTNALLDRTQQLALCRYADGTNPVTGVSTRKSLGCGSARKFRAQSPSNPDGPQVSEEAKEAFRATMPEYRK